MIGVSLVLAGCSSALDALPDAAEAAPARATYEADAKRIGAETKLTTPLEIAGPLEAKPMTVTHWLVCLRSTSPDQARQTYALFYRNAKFDSYRFTAITDRCDEQTFRPL